MQEQRDVVELAFEAAARIAARNKDATAHGAARHAREVVAKLLGVEQVEFFLENVGEQKVLSMKVE